MAADSTNPGDRDYHYSRIDDTCDLCREYANGPTGDLCLAVFPTGAGHFECTRPAGHDGKHAACGSGHDGHPIVQWE